MGDHFWLRHESKLNEERTILLPEHAAELISSGHHVTVEKSSCRCVPVEEFVAVGCDVAEENAWANGLAPDDVVVIGLKSLLSNATLKHKHVYFAHCFKEQSGWEELLGRFSSAKGNLWDLEFLVDETGRRVAAFGDSAGFIGMACAILAWCAQKNNGILGPLTSFKTFPDLVKYVRFELDKVNKGLPTAIVIGALGRVGKGAVRCAEQCGLVSITKWDLEETAPGGPFSEIVDHDIFVNCVNLFGDTPPFIDMKSVGKEGRKLTVVSDVSCDYVSPHNPVRIYSEGTDFDKPVLRILEGGNPLDVVAIDHLPSMVSRDSSKEFADLIIPHLKVFPNSPVWGRALELFEKKKKEAGV